jgi:hypothetical protein
MIQAVEYLPSTCETLSSNPRATNVYTNYVSVRESSSET